jgi:hypothetical protein
LRDLVRGTLPAPSADAFWLGLVTAVVILLGLCAAADAAIEARAAGAGAAAQPRPAAACSYGLVYGVAIAAVLALLLWLVRDAKLVLGSLGRHRGDVRQCSPWRAGCSCGS